MKKFFSFLLVFLILSTFAVQPALSASAASSESVYFYNQLDAEEKNVYNAMKSALYGKTDIPSEIQIQLKTPLVSAPQSTRPNDQQATQLVNGMMEDIMPCLQAALDALLADCPSIFFLDLTSESSSDPSCSFGISAREEKTPENQYVMKTTAVTMKVAVKSAYQGNLASYITKLQNAVSAFSPAGTTRYEKLISIHTFVCQSTSYDREFLDAKAHDAISVFEAGHKSVCEGYAKAVKMLCDEAGIPCILVTGYGVTSSSSTERHMWNLVQMEDGRWYGLDATWDDQDSGICTDFFLSGSTTLPSRGFYQRKFSESHVSLGDLSGTQSKIFTYPTMYTTAYSPYIGIAIKNMPQKLTYTTRDTEVDLTGLILTLQLASGTGPEVTSGFSSDAVDFSAVGVRTVTVRYQGYSAQFEITVTQAPPQQDENDNGGSQNGGNQDEGDENQNGGNENNENQNGGDEDTGGESTENGDHGETDKGEKDPVPDVEDDGDNQHQDEGDGDEEDNAFDGSQQGGTDSENGGSDDDKSTGGGMPPMVLWVVIGVAAVGCITVLVVLVIKK